MIRHPFPVAALSAPIVAPIAACSLRVRPGERMVRLIPGGTFDAPRGAMAGSGPWHLTPEAAARLIAASRTRTADILIDFEHQALLAADNGKPVPAAGWIDPQSLEFRPDGAEPGLYGAVTWAGDVPAMLERDEYRYLSPVFTYDGETGEPRDLMHVALTNTPAINGPALQAALSARIHASGGAAPETRMENHLMNELLKKLLAALGLPETTSETDALAALSALRTKADSAQAEIAALKAAPPATPDPAKYVPVEMVQGMKEQIAALSAQVGDEVERIVEAAIQDNRLLEKMRDWALKEGKRDIAALKSYIELLSPIPALNGMQTKGTPPVAAPGSLSADELAVCKTLGLTPEQFTKGKTDLAEKEAARHGRA